MKKKINPQAGDIWKRTYLNGECNHYLLLKPIQDNYNDDVLGWHMLQLEGSVDTINIISVEHLWMKIT